MTPHLRPDGRPSGEPWWRRLAHRRAQDGRGGRGPQAGRGSGPTAFVLAGGGSRGAVQVGMLDELVKRGIRADRVYGASVGAVNAAAYCGDPSPAGMAELERVWRSLSGDVVFPRRRSHGPWTYFQQRPAVHANTGLRRIVEDGLRFERLEDAAVPLEVVATSLVDGRECWLTEGPAVDAVLASAAIPAMFPPVTIDGVTLIDGGVVDNVPISRAIEHGARTIYVLLCGPLHYRPRPARRPAESVLTAFFVAVHARFARELAALPPGVDVVVFSGGGDPAADYRDFSGTVDLIEAGRAEVARVLDGRGQGTPGTSGAPGVRAVAAPGGAGEPAAPSGAGAPAAPGEPDASVGRAAPHGAGAAARGGSDPGHPDPAGRPPTAPAPHRRRSPDRVSRPAGGMDGMEGR